WSKDAVAMLPDADMVFIDANHDFKYVMEDLQGWEPKARILICGHDFRSIPEPDVEPALNAYFGQGNYEFFQSIWYKWKRNL
ncbi:MAG: hypothetical protein V1800_17255, partial [Candidatus Latescibacterota bacterium]